MTLCCVNLTLNIEGDKKIFDNLEDLSYDTVYDTVVGIIKKNNDLLVNEGDFRSFQ